MIKPSQELYYLTLTILFTSVIWVPIILNRLKELGVWTALKNPQPDLRPETDWAYRLSNAHRNAIENLVVFAPLILIINAFQINNPTTALAAMLFFYSRIAHAVIYTFGIPLLRTIAFFIGFVCQIYLGLHILGVV